MTEIYGSLRALVPTEKLLKEAGEAIANPAAPSKALRFPKFLAQQVA